MITLVVAKRACHFHIIIQINVHALHARILLQLQFQLNFTVTVGHKTLSSVHPLTVASAVAFVFSMQTVV